MTEPLPLVRPPVGAMAPPYPRVAIVGVGLIGGSIALAVRQRWPSSLIIGVDRKPIIERAMVAHMVDVGADDLGMAGDADLVVLAAPVAINQKLLQEDLPAVIARDSTITDVGSTKRGMAAAARQLPSRFTFIGGHPMAGAAVKGLEHARADLFNGRPWILCCAEPTAEVQRLREFVGGLGARPVDMSAEQHDQLLAFLSHLPQLAASSLMHVIGEHAGRDGLRLTGRGLRDTTRLASSPPEIWKDIVATNADNIQAALDCLIESLRDLRNDLARGEALERIFESARQWKAALDDE